MPRQAVFSIPTKLWNAAEGWHVFGVGEMEPGGAWFETEGGPPSSEATIAGLKADYLAARHDVEQMQRRLDSQTLDLSEMAADRDGAAARNAALLRRLATAGLQPPVDITVPEDWQEMPFLALRALARNISGQPLTDKPSCVAAIREHVAAT